MHLKKKEICFISIFCSLTIEMLFDKMSTMSSWCSWSILTIIWYDNADKIFELEPCFISYCSSSQNQKAKKETLVNILEKKMCFPPPSHTHPPPKNTKPIYLANNITCKFWILFHILIWWQLVFVWRIYKLFL